MTDQEPGSKCPKSPTILAVGDVYNRQEADDYMAFLDGLYVADLRKQLAQCQAELKAEKKAHAAIQEHSDYREKELDRLRQEAIAYRDKAKGEYWVWQGDGTDYLKSLVCPILIQADDFRTILARYDTLKDAASQVLDNLYAEWNDLSKSIQEDVIALHTALGDDDDK